MHPDDNITRSELRQLQLEILNAVVDFCRRNDLRCWLYFGSLLGAVRHHGFIPWDDDIDLVMPRKDYTAFLKTFPQDERFGLLSLANCPKCSKAYAKVYDRRTDLRESLTCCQTLGVNIDIFPLDNLPDDPGEAKRLVRRLHFRQKMLDAKLIRFRSGRSLAKNLVLAACKLLFLPFSVFRIAAKINRMAQLYSSAENSTHVATLTTMTYGEREIMRREWFAGTTDLPFEGAMYPVPCGWDEILTHMYGDYMTPPPEDKRRSTHVFSARWKR